LLKETKYANDAFGAIFWQIHDLADQYFFYLPIGEVNSKTTPGNRAKEILFLGKMARNAISYRKEIVCHTAKPYEIVPWIIIQYTGKPTMEFGPLNLSASSIPVFGKYLVSRPIFHSVSTRQYRRGRRSSTESEIPDDHHHDHPSLLEEPMNLKAYLRGVYRTKRTRHERLFRHVLIVGDVFGRFTRH
jgi:hypothetical protein